MPPSSTITMPSIERETHATSGEIVPLAKANSPPATPPNSAGDGEADPMHALDVDADRFRAQRRVASGAHRIAERREQKAPQQQDARDHQRERQQIEAPARLLNGACGQMPRMPFEPPVTSSHWNRIDQTICAKASVSIAR